MSCTTRRCRKAEAWRSRAASGGMHASGPGARRFIGHTIAAHPPPARPGAPASKAPAGGRHVAKRLKLAPRQQRPRTRPHRAPPTRGRRVRCRSRGRLGRPIPRQPRARPASRPGRPSTWPAWHCSSAGPTAQRVRPLKELPLGSGGRPTHRQNAGPGKACSAPTAPPRPMPAGQATDQAHAALVGRGHQARLHKA